MSGTADSSQRGIRKGNYGLTINRATADGLFAGDFPTFSRSEVEVHNSQGNATGSDIFRQ